ncbi:hypothetical protein O5559_28055, partial [Escherichia coli]|nr:hypothetical protein [Escherichia coli]
MPGSELHIKQESSSVQAPTSGQTQRDKLVAASGMATLTASNAAQTPNPMPIHDKSPRPQEFAAV